MVGAVKLMAYMGPAPSSVLPPLSTEIRIAGIDEVGRGCIAGPVVAAAVVLPPAHGIEGLRDSKQLSPARRIKLAARIRETAMSFGIGEASVEEIDDINILQATFLAMRRAVAGLAMALTICRVDGNQDPGLGCETQLIVGGDRSDESIMAASILAKVTRDQGMIDLDSRFPAYHLARNKGYGTRDHLAALDEHGPCEIHRMSFAPCRRAKLARSGDSSLATSTPTPISA